eukprot:Nitzschia sp. Nitz4//scaffold393_size11853//5108//7097//NITZ4_009021-RA/size11853-snap-gene-0.16-mRNA-1//-1//CDS//3329550220//7288//frame0
MATNESKLKALSSSNRREKRGDNSVLVTAGTSLASTSATTMSWHDTTHKQISSKEVGDLRLQEAASLPQANESFSSVENSTRMSTSSHKGSARDFRSSRKGTTDTTKKGVTRNSGSNGTSSARHHVEEAAPTLGAVRVSGVGVESMSDDYTISQPPLRSAQDPDEARIPSVATATAVARDELEMEVRRQLMSEAVMAQVVAVDPEVPPPASRMETSVKTDEQLDDAKSQSKVSHHYTSLCLAFCCGVLLVGAIVLGVFFGVLWDNSDGTSSALDADNQGATMPTSPPTDNYSQPVSTPTEFPSNPSTPVGDGTESLLIDFLSAYVPDLGEDPQAPSTMALHWMEDEGITANDDMALETFVLVTVYFATGGDTWLFNTNWLDRSVDICDWYPGGMCSSSAENNYRSLRATTVSSSSQSSSRVKLQKLDIDDINLQGTFPTEIGLLTDLTTLHVKNNTGLVGTIPTEIGNLSLLGEFLGGYTSLTGTLPSTLFELNNLHKFDLEHASLITGTLPVNLWTLDSLVFLNLEGASFSGPLPKGTDGASPSIVLLKGNNLSGSIPDEEAASWDQLEVLDLSYNRLTGTIPYGFIGNLNDDLVQLRLEGNSLSGTVSEDLCDRLEAIDSNEQESFIFIALAVNVAHTAAGMERTAEPKKTTES